MNQLEVVSSVINMYPSCKVVKIIGKDEVAEIIYKNGDVFYLHYGIIYGNPQFAISDENGLLLTSFISGAEAVSYFVSLLKPEKIKS